jgi:hypothetical protein
MTELLNDKKEEKIIEKETLKSDENKQNDLTKKMASVTTVPVSNLYDSVEHEVKVTLAEGMKMKRFNQSSFILFYFSLFNNQINLWSLTLLLYPSIAFNPLNSTHFYL